MISSKKSDAKIVLMVNSSPDSPKHYSVFQSEKFFLFSLSFLTILGTVIVGKLMVVALTQLITFSGNIATIISQLDTSIEVFALVAIAGSTITLFLLIKLVQFIGKLFQAFWESLEID